MPQNTFLTTPDVEKYLFYGHVSGGLEACANASKHIFINSRRKNIIFFLVVWKHAQMHQKTFFTTPDAQMHQNTFLTTPDAKKHLF
jgi:hypothetical protein